MDGNLRIPTENIDEVILRLLRLEPNEIEDIDYETYKSNIAEILIENEISQKKITEKEIILLKDEFDRVKNKTGRFVLKSKKRKIKFNNSPVKNVSNIFKNIAIVKPIETTQETSELIQKTPLDVSSLKPKEETTETPKEPKETFESESKTKFKINKVPQVLIKHYVNEVILTLLRLKSDTEISAQVYFEIIRNKLSAHRLLSKKLPFEEQNLLQDELRKVWKIKDKDTKRLLLLSKKATVTSPPPPPGSNGPNDPGDPPKTSAIVKAPPSGKITTEKLFNTPRVEPVNVRDITPDRSSQTDPLTRISNTLDSILETLTNINNFDREQANRGRRDAENRRRGQRESELESKSFEGIKKALSAITKPFQSIWDKIVNFITNVILGRIVIKLIEWIADPGNQEKIQSIIRFLGDHWPTLLALYLRFGTGIGRFVGKLTRGLVKGSFKLVKLVAGLAAKLGLKRAGKLASFLGGPRGRAIATGVGIAADVAVTAGTAFGASKLFGGEKQEPVSPEPVQEFSGGGSVRIPKFSGGGFANFGNMFKGAGFGSMFGPLGMLAGAGLGGAAGSGMFNGFVSGEKGVDKVPAMLSDGEFVMSPGAVKKYGVDTLEAMNAAGGGTNIPKIAKGITYAAGGGMIGETPKEIRLRQAYESKLGKDLASKLTNKQISEISKYYNSLPSKVASNIDSKIIKGFGNPLRDMAEQMIRGNKSGSVTRSINALHSAENILTDEIKHNRSQLRQTGSRLKTTRIDPSRMLPSAGQSSANAMREAAKAAKNMRPPIPATSSIVPYTGGGLARTGVTGGLSVGFGGLKSAGIEMLASYLIDRGFDKVNAMIIAKKIDEGKKLTGNKKENYIERLRNVVDREEKWQRGFGGVFDSIIGMGKESSSQKLSKSAREILEGMGSGAYKGGGIVGGRGLKEQSFKDAPKTMVMTDDKGRPFVGHKAMKNGKLTYVRPSKPGTGTTNPLEMLGRFINPGAYKDSDSKVAMKNQKIAMVNALESFQKQGMAPDAQARMMKQMGGNLKDVQNDLNYRKKRGDLIKQGKLKSDGTSYTSRERMRMSISRSQTKNPAPKPLPKPKPKPQIAGGGMGGRRGGGSSSSSGSKAPSHSAKHSKESVSKSVFGIMATGR